METAFRMQTEAPDVFDVSKESKATLDMYGPGSTALGCLMAARLVEKGVRMVQTYYGKGDPWDAHNDIMTYRKLAKDSDQAYAALIKDLKQRGLFEDTLVVCGTEFGRTPAIQTSNDNVGGVVNGRDHNTAGFSIWLAGGGVKGGMTYGATDEFGFKAVEKKVHVHDLHATILYLLGIDHTKLTYHYSGRDFRLTDTEGQVIHDIVASRDIGVLDRDLSGVRARLLGSTSALAAPAARPAAVEPVAGLSRRACCRPWMSGGPKCMAADRRGRSTSTTRTSSSSGSRAASTTRSRSSI